MIDDSLSDVQQEKQMSVKELKLTTQDADLKIEKVLESFRVECVCLDGLAVMYLDRSQAHLLMLYLQEHLRAGVSDKELWLCDKCKRYHNKDYICEMLK